MIRLSNMSHKKKKRHSSLVSRKKMVSARHKKKKKNSYHESARLFECNQKDIDELICRLRCKYQIRKRRKKTSPITHKISMYQFSLASSFSIQ